MGSVRMDTKQVLYLLFTHLLVCAGQDSGAKSRFDEILSTFGFGENPIALEQQTPSNQALNVNSEPLKKDLVNKHNDKKKFSEALEKFGFGSSNKRNHNSRSKEYLKVKAITRDKFPLNQAASYSGNGLSGSQISFKNPGKPTFPPLLLIQKTNQPQFVKVVKSTFSPKHQITPRATKQKALKAPSAKPLKEKFGQKEKSDEKNNRAKDKNFKKIKKTKKNKNGNIKKPHKGHTKANDPTLFVTPKTAKPVRPNIHISKKNVLKKKPYTLVTKHPKKTKNIDSSSSKTYHRGQSKIRHGSSNISFTTDQPSPKDIPVDFGERVISTQRPRHSRQQDLEDKNNALAALFDVAGGAKNNKSNFEPAVVKKKKKVKKPINLTENNILRVGLQQSSQSGNHVNTNNKKKKKEQQNLKTSPSQGTRENTHIKKDNISKRPQNKTNPLSSVFSVIKHEGRDKSVSKSSQINAQTRRFNIPNTSTQRSPISSTTRSNTLTATTTQVPGITTPRQPSISGSARPGKRTQTIKKERDNQKINNEIRSTTRRPSLKSNPAPTKQTQFRKPTSTRISHTKPHTHIIEEGRSQTHLTRIATTTEKANHHSNQLKSTPKNKQGTQSRFEEILNKFGFSGRTATNAPATNVTPARKTGRKNTTKAVKIQTEKSLPKQRGISINSKSKVISFEKENKDNVRPNTTPFTVFNSPSSKPPKQIHENNIQINKKSRKKSLGNNKVSLKKEPQTSLSNRDISLGRARSKTISTSGVQKSKNERNLSSSRGRGASLNIAPSRTVQPRRIVSSQLPRRQSERPYKEQFDGSNILNNLIKIAGRARTNPEVKVEETKILTINSKEREVKPSIGIQRKAIGNQETPLKASIVNPFKAQNKQERKESESVGVNDILIGRQNTKFSAEQDRSKGPLLGPGPLSLSAQGQNNKLIRSEEDIDKHRRIQPIPRRPSIKTDEHDRDDDRRPSNAGKSKERPAARNRPDIRKSKSSGGKARPPAAAGCFQICDTLIFEVYKLLGGGLCDC